MHIISKYKILTLLIAVGACCVACRQDEPTVTENVFDCGYAIYYGPFYENKGIEADVWAMEIYSGDVRYDDSLHSYVGNGRILTMTDIFAPRQSFNDPSTMHLPTGMYYTDSTFTDFTFIEGRREAGYDIGAYLTTIVDGKTTYIEYLTDGSMDIRTDSLDRTQMSFVLTRNHRRFEASFVGNMDVYVPL